MAGLDPVCSSWLQVGCIAIHCSSFLLGRFCWLIWTVRMDRKEQRKVSHFLPEFFRCITPNFKLSNEVNFSFPVKAIFGTEPTSFPGSAVCEGGLRREQTSCKRDLSKTLVNC